jgi:hypothetical protein
MKKKDQYCALLCPALLLPLRDDLAVLGSQAIGIFPSRRFFLLFVPFAALSPSRLFFHTASSDGRLVSNLLWLHSTHV